MGKANEISIKQLRMATVTKQGENKGFFVAYTFWIWNKTNTTDAKHCILFHGKLHIKIKCDT